MMIYQHKKRGTEYRILHGEEYEDCIASSSQVAAIDHEPFVVYQDIESGKVWVRPRAEFFDGRFLAIERALPLSGYRSIERLTQFVKAIEKCPDNRSVASLDASDGITCKDMRLFLRMLIHVPKPTGETET